jgi:oligopeptidase B
MSQLNVPSNFQSIYASNLQPINKIRHTVRFGKSDLSCNLDTTIIENDLENDLVNDLTNPKSELEFDESKYMNPPIKHIDNYYWLRDDSRTNKDVLDFLNAENDLTNKVLESTKQLQETLYTEIKSYLKETYDSYPMPYGLKGWNSDYYYFIRTLKGKPYPIHMRINNKTKEEELLLDENEIADKYKKLTGSTTFDLSGFEVTDDHVYMSYGIDTKGSEDYKLKIIKIDDQKDIQHDIPVLSYCDYFWYQNGQDYYIYYMLHTESRKSYKLMRYDFQNKTHMEIYRNDDPLFEISASVSDDHRFIIISANSYATHDILYFTNDKPSVLHQITPMRPDHKYSVEMHGSKLFILTNKNNATNFKVMVCDLDDENQTSEKFWKDYLSYDPAICIEGIKALKDYLLILYKTDGNSCIKVVPVGLDHSYDLEKAHDIKVPNVESLNMVSQDIYDTNEIIISYTDLKRPNTLSKYNLETKELVHLRTKEVPNYDQELYHTERLKAISHDGKLVPISLVYRKDMFKSDGTNPLYLYGYGAYGVTIDPNFNPNILPLLDRGFVYAIGHVRGGAFLGTEWYEDGKMLNKRNTFYDFIACAEHLIKNKYTSKKLITIEGRSAGGLLVGASMILRPDLFNTVIAGVPFVDVLNTMSDPTIPLTTPEWEEWGNPNIQEYYEYMKQYSPYDNIKEGVSYPNILALGGLNDPRVQYWEPAKFIAKLREHDPNSGIKLLKTEMDQGHFGNTDRYKYMHEKAFDYAFVFITYGINN